MTPYLLWDWNGTLLDDTQACVDALNAMLRRRGLKPITLAYYRDHFSFPVRPFYASLGVKLENEDWNRLAQEYHDFYHALLQPSRSDSASTGPVTLNAEAVAALELARSLGCRQAIISALRQDMLDADTARYGVRGYFDYIYGTDNLDGGSKLARAHELLADIRSSPHTFEGPRIRQFEDFPFVLIGDSLHDREVADDLGVGCVLFSGGGHSRARLAAVAPTEDSLCACVRRAWARW